MFVNCRVIQEGVPCQDVWSWRPNTARCCVMSEVEFGKTAVSRVTETGFTMEMAWQRNLRIASDRNGSGCSVRRRGRLYTAVSTIPLRKESLVPHNLGGDLETGKYSTTAWLSINQETHGWRVKPGVDAHTHNFIRTDRSILIRLYWKQVRLVALKGDSCPHIILTGVISDPKF